jgi:hypothetical protein
VTPRVWHGIEQCAAPHPLRSGKTIIGGATVRFIAVAVQCERHRRGGELQGGRAQAAFGRPNTGFQPTLRRTRLIQSTGSTRLAPLKPNVGPFISAQRLSQFRCAASGHTLFHNLMAARCTAGQRRGTRKAQPHTHVQWLGRYRRRPGVQRLRPLPACTPRAAGADRFCDGECARRVLA